MNFLTHFIRTVSVPIVFLGILLVSCGKESKEFYKGVIVSDFDTDIKVIEEGDAVTFENKSEGAIAYYSWIFEGGTPASSTEKDPPPIVYESEGVYPVRLVVINHENKVSTLKKDFITVEKGPSEITADFTSDKTQIMAGEQITFTDESTGIPRGWEWEFIPESGTPMIASGRNPTVQFDVPGVYSVKLKATNRLYEGEVLKEGYIRVLDPYELEAFFSAEQLFTYTGKDLKFTDVSTGQVSSWNWTFQGGIPATSTEQHPTVTYANPGRYKVTLQISNNQNSSTKEVEGMIMVAPGNDLLALLPLNGVKDDHGPLNLAVTEHTGVTYSGASRYANGLGNTTTFDGTGYLHIPAAEAKHLGTSSYSVSVWLKSSSTSLMFVWAEGGTGGTPAYSSYLRVNSNATTSLSFQRTGFITNLTKASDFATLVDNQWHHVVCVYDVTSTTKRAYVYIDGNFIKSTNITGTIENISNNMGFFIGTGNVAATGPASKFTGSLSDMIIYKRALTEAEVAQLSTFK